MQTAELVAAVIEELFVRGRNCTNEDWLGMHCTSELNNGKHISAAALAEQWKDVAGLTEMATIDGIAASPKDGACEEWLANHEAGHAIVGLEAGLTLWGIRFGNGGFLGECRFEVVEWGNLTDEEALRKQIQVDVAGNMAELLIGIPERHERLSALYQNRVEGDRPTDFISADKKAIHLSMLLFERRQVTPTTEEMWQSCREIAERAEKEADEILRAKQDALRRLATRLREGPLTGTEVRGIVG